MQRYFAQVSQGTVTLSPEDAFHAITVMRMHPGERLEAVDQGQVHLAEVVTLKPLTIRVVKTLHDNRELPVQVTLFYALAKGEKTDWVVQKATELGVTRIIGLISERTIVRVSPEESSKKIQRYSKIIKEAAEQSLRNVLPTFEAIVPFKDIQKYHFDSMAIAYEGEALKGTDIPSWLAQAPTHSSVGIIIGAEGGFSPSEVLLANQAGYVSVSLGRRILRSETAALYALSLIASYFERKPYEQPAL